MIEPPGLGGGLTNRGDRDFARHLRRSMARSCSGVRPSNILSRIVGM
jgi:hypothetical protein